MPPTSAGRHCAARQQVVVSTHETGAKSLACLARATSHTCGRCGAGRVARPLQPAAASRCWRSWVATLLTVGNLGPALAKAAVAQVAPVTYCAGVAATVAGAAAPTPIRQLPHESLQASDTVRLRGTVRDAQTHEKLLGVTVLLKGSDERATITKADGSFTLALPAGSTLAHLVFRYVGYTLAEQTVDVQASAGAPLQVALAPEEDLWKGEGIVAHARPAYPWHPRAFYRWVSYWVTRPFRR